MSTPFPFLSLPRELRDQLYTYLLIRPMTGVSINVVPNNKSASVSADTEVKSLATTLCKAIYTFDPLFPAPHTAIFLVNRQLNLEAWQTLAREGAVQAGISDHSLRDAGG
ncbi:MAG: hypothetical protein M1812_005783 [Candelaria pacifica]|nr:MAG: hypothetical protein M1812_005783 [Candelaria pacifica]